MKVATARAAAMDLRAAATRLEALQGPTSRELEQATQLTLAALGRMTRAMRQTVTDEALQGAAKGLTS